MPKMYMGIVKEQKATFKMDSTVKQYIGPTLAYHFGTYVVAKKMNRLLNRLVATKASKVVLDPCVSKMYVMQALEANGMER